VTVELDSHHPQPTAGELRDTFDGLQTAFERAVANCGVEERAIEVAGKVVLLRFAGQAMVDRVMLAFSHVALAHPPAAIDLTISVWDSTSTAVRLPENRLFPAVGGPDVHPLYHSSNLILVFQPGDRVLSVLDTDSSSAIYSAADAATFPSWERAAPLRAILNWWLQLRGLQVIHSGAVGRPGGGVLLAGRGGSGKTTSALQCLRSGLHYAGEDYLLIQPSPPVAHSLYCSAKLEVAQCARHRELLPEARLVAPSDEKCLGFVDTAYPDQVARTLPVVAVLLPTITGRADTRVRPTSSASALLALGPATILQLRSDGSATFSTLSRLLNQVPSFSLEVGTQLETIPESISSLLDQLGVP
jgi:hypothetical protein